MLFEYTVYSNKTPAAGKSHSEIDQIVLLTFPFEWKPWFRVISHCGMNIKLFKKFVYCIDYLHVVSAIITKKYGWGFANVS